MRSIAALCLSIALAACAGDGSTVSRSAAAAPARSAPEPAPADFGAALAAAIEASDLDAALVALCDAYAANGMPCAETVHLEKLAKDDVMSHAGILHAIAMPPMPRTGEGFAYWDNWSTILAGGSWQPRSLFRDDEEARRVANMLLASVLVHELGHHVGSRFGCSHSGPGEELQADELSLAVMRGLLGARLGVLEAKMRAVADAMIAAVPPEARVEVPTEGDLRAWVAAQPALPKAIPGYVTLHLSRQRRLLRDLAPFAKAAQGPCLAPHAAHLASRIVRPGRVRTVLRTPESANVTDLVALDPEAGLWVATIAPEVTIRRLGTQGLVQAVSLPADASDVVAFAVASPDRFALADYAHVWLVERGTVQLVGQSQSSPVAIAFDEAGALHAAYRDEATWRVAPVGMDVRRPEVVLRLDVEARDWDDGPVATARASPTLFALASGSGAGVVFVDAMREAVRTTTRNGVATLAGSLPGRRDGASEDATFFGIDAIGRLANGGIAVAEQDFAHGGTVVRVIER